MVLISADVICAGGGTDRQVSLRKQDQCTLVDGGHRLKWVVRTAAGEEAEAPSVCFLLPPPDTDAVDAVEKLKRLYEMSIMLWQRKQLRMRQNMIKW